MSNENKQTLIEGKSTWKCKRCNAFAWTENLQTEPPRDQCPLEPRADLPPGLHEWYPISQQEFHELEEHNKRKHGGRTTWKCPRCGNSVIQPTTTPDKPPSVLNCPGNPPQYPPGTHEWYWAGNQFINSEEHKC